MSTIGFNPISWAPSFVTDSEPLKKETIIRIAISAILIVGLLLSYFLGAPWFVPVSFFLLAFIPLFPLGRIGSEDINNQK